MLYSDIEMNTWRLEKDVATEVSIKESGTCLNSRMKELRQEDFHSCTCSHFLPFLLLTLLS